MTCIHLKQNYKVACISCETHDDRSILILTSLENSGYKYLITNAHTTLGKISEIIAVK